MSGQQYDGRYEGVVGRLGGVHGAVFAPSACFYDERDSPTACLRR